MVEGVNTGVVIGGLLLGVALALGGLIWVASSLMRSPVEEPVVESVAAAPTAPPAVEGSENNVPPPTPDSAPLPPTRGYVLLGSKTYLISRAEAKLSNSRDKIAVVLFGNDELSAPPISLVVELNPGTTECVESAVGRYRLMVKLPYDPTTGGPYERTIERLPAPDGFVEIITLKCERRRSGAFSINLVGSWSPDDGAPTPTLTYGFTVQTTLR